MKTLTTLLAALLTACITAASATAADNNDALKKEINKIKKSSSYIYSEVTASTEDEARALAEEGLWNEINAWATSQKKLSASSSFLVKNVNERIESFSLPRGNMYRSFLFVKKADITGGDNAEIIANTTTAETPAATSQPAATPSWPAAVNELAKYTEYSTFVDKIQQLKAEGKVSHFARYASLSNPDIYYLAVYNRAGVMVAILSPGESRLNVATGEPDKVANYSGCGAIGFTLPSSN